MTPPTLPLGIEVAIGSILTLTGFDGAIINPEGLIVRGGVVLDDADTVFVVDTDPTTDNATEYVSWSGLPPGTYEVRVDQGPLIPTVTNARIRVRHTFQVESQQSAQARTTIAQLSDLIARLRPQESEPAIAELIARIEAFIEETRQWIEPPIVAPGGDADNFSDSMR